MMVVVVTVIIIFVIIIIIIKLEGSLRDPQVRRIASSP
jgi:hypothetical protein